MRPTSYICKFANIDVTAFKMGSVYPVSNFVNTPVLRSVIFFLLAKGYSALGTTRIWIRETKQGP